MEGALYFIAGCLVSWLLAHIYYRKSSVHPPEWALPLIEKLPENKPSKEKLLELFQEALDLGEVKYDELTNAVACRECGAPAADFEVKYLGGNDYVDVVDVKCPACGWSNAVEI